MQFLRTVAVSAVLVPALASAQPASTVAERLPSADAYYEFMLARRLESGGDTKGALAALERAQKLDPASAALHAERAGLYARENDGDAARKAAEAALAIEPGNVEGHRILGLVYSAMSEPGAPATAGETPASLRKKAIEHLRSIQKSPVMATDLNLQVTLGRLLLNSDQADEAVVVLENVAAQAPYAAEPHALLAQALTAQGRYQEAAESLTRAAEINPRHYITLGDLYERLGRWAGAAQAYGEAVANIRTPSRDLRLRWITALINVPGGEGAARAREALADLLKGNPNDTRLLYLMSSASREMGDTAGAEEAARKILSIDPTSMAGLNALARALSERYAFREIVDVVTPLAKDPARAKGNEDQAAAALVELGVAHQQLGEYETAIAVFESARALVPDDSRYEVYVAQALVSARQFDKADSLAQQALARSPGDPRFLRVRAQALSRAGRGAEAITLLEGASKAATRDPQIALALADAYAAEKRYDDALRVVKEASAQFGDGGPFAMRLIGLYEEAGRPADAERELRQMVERDPLDSTALNYLGYLLAERNERLDEAQVLIERALAIEPNNPSFLDSLGWALFRQGKADAALEPLAKAAAALPANSVILDHYGDALASQGRWAEAVQAWERALAGDLESIDRSTLDKKIADAQRRR
jgi:tetratricopeptide (TPR) repeat protein